MNDLAADYTNSKTGLTLKEEQFLTFLFGECKGNFEQAMAKAAITESPASLRKKLKSQIQEMTKDYLASATTRAAIELVGTMDDPSLPGVKNLISAAKEVLDRGGVAAQEEHKVVENHIFILPAKTARVIDHEA
jgi:hypothetical protein